MRYNTGMNAFPPLDNARRMIRDVRTNVSGSRFFHDRFSTALLIAALAINGITFIWLVLRIHPTEVPVPVRYSNLLSGFDQLGPWYFPYFIAVYALAVTVFNGLLAYQSFNRSRLVSFFLLVASTVVAAFSLIIALAFGAIR
jgi:hypothetical protein